MKQKRRFQMKRVTFKMLVGVFMIWTLTVFTFGQISEVQCHRHGRVRKQLDAYLNGLVKEGKFSGSALVAKDGKIILKKGYGMANYEEEKPNRPVTVFSIASMSKAFTAVSILMLQDQGLLNIHDTIDQYLPWFPYGDQITIHHCLSHTSGLFLYLNDANSDFWVYGDLTKYYEPYELLDYFVNRPLYFEPGTDWMYCNSGYVVLGIIIEELSGMTFREFINTNILKPLRMRHTSYDQYGTDFLNQKAVGYAANPPLYPPEWFKWQPSVIYSAGGMFSTVVDMYKWDQALYTNKLLSRDALKAMFSPYAENYGYGWFNTYMDHNGQMHKQIWHPGTMPGFHSIINRFVDDRLTVILLANVSTPYVDLSNLSHFDLKYFSEDLARIVLDNK